jgi:hypothetical protein
VCRIVLWDGWLVVVIVIGTNTLIVIIIKVIIVIITVIALNRGLSGTALRPFP